MGRQLELATTTSCCYNNTSLHLLLDSAVQRVILEFSQHYRYKSDERSPVVTRVAMDALLDIA